jgi:hypothetical protein
VIAQASNKYSKAERKERKKTEKERIHIDEIMHGQRAIKHQSIQLAPEAKSHPLHIV